MAARVLPPVLLVALAAACGATGGTRGPAGAADPMGADLFPFEARASRYVLGSGEPRTVRVEPSGDGAVVWIDGPAGTRRIDVTRSGEALSFSGGPDAATELIRVGAAPGASWTSGEATVRFEGWERVTVPAGTWDAARVSTATGPESLRVVQTWWFAPGAGIVRLRSDRGGIFTEEMSLVGPR